MPGLDPASERGRQRPRSAALPAGGWGARHALALEGEALRQRLTGWIALEIDRRRPFLWLPVFFALGVIAYFSAEIEPGPAAPLIAAGLSAIAAVASRRRFAMQATALAALCFFAGFGAGVLRARLVAAPVLAAPAFLTVEGRIESIDWTGQGGRLILRLHDVSPAIERMPERVRLTFRGRPPLTAGQGLRASARLAPPGAAAVPGGFDFQREAYFQRLGAVGFITGNLERLESLPPLPLRARLTAAIDNARNGLTQRIIEVIGGQGGAIAAALVTGKRGLISEAENEALRAAGIYHIVSISGLHMVLAAGLFFWGARLLLTLVPGLALSRPIKKWAAVAAMAGATAYCVFSGSEVATERSLIMTLVMFAAILFDRPALAMRNLAIAGLLVLSIEPETLLGPSFQMSFAAVAGLVAYGEWERLRHRSRPAATTRAGWLATALVRLALGIIVTTLIAGLATAPFQAFHFHRLNPYGVLGNALAIPLCSFVVMPAALAGVTLLPFGLDAPVWQIMGYGVDGIRLFAAWVAQFDGSIAFVARFPAGALGAMALGVAVATLFTTPAFRLAGIALLGLSAVKARTAEQPALILDASGRMALVRGDDGRLTLVGAQHPNFALAQWLPGDRDARAPRDPTLTRSATCDRAACIGRLADGRAISVVTDAAAFADDCERAAIIVTPLVAPMACRNHAEVYDRDYFSSYGATYLYPRATSFRHETHKNARFDRPWAPRRGPSPAATPAQSTPPTMPGQVWDNQSPEETPAQ